MIILKFPINSWPFREHLKWASLFVALACTMVWIKDSNYQHQLQIVKMQRVDIDAKMLAFNQQTNRPRRDESLPILPNANNIQDLVRDISRCSQSVGVRINTMTIDTKSPNQSQIGQVQFNVSGSAQYLSIKTMLAELLNRYPALTVSALNLKRGAKDQLKVDFVVTLVLHIK